MKVFLNKPRLNIFLIFFLLSLITSLFEKLTSTYDKDILFKIVLTEKPEDKVIYEKSHDSVFLKLRGLGFSFAKYYFKTPELKISVKKLKELKNSYLWDYSSNFNDMKLNFNSNHEILTISEDSMYFYYDQYDSEIKYVKSNIIINYKSGFDSFYPPLISNDSVLILGPKEILNNINYLKTEVVELSDVSSDINLNLKILKPDFDNIIIDVNEINYQLQVDKYTEEIVNVPIDILSNNSDKFNFYPKQLSVKYSISIDDYKKVLPSDFRIECIYDKNESILTPFLIKKPDFVKNAKLSSNKVQLIILE